MTAQLLSYFHVLAAIVLFSAAIIHFLVHPLSVVSVTISLVLASLGGVVIAQEVPAILSSRWIRSKPSLLNSYLVRALCFLVATAVLFDRLIDLPCDVPRQESSYSTTPAKFLVPGSQARNDKIATESQSAKSGTNLIKQQEPPVFGTAFYLCRSLAPTCTRIESLPNQVASSVAWVNISANQTSRALVFTACTTTLAVCLVYLGLALLHRSGRVGMSLGMAHVSAQDQDDPHSLRFVEVMPHRCNEQMIKESASASSAYRLNLHSNDPSYGRCMPPDLFQEQVLALPGLVGGSDRHRCASDARSSRISPSLHRTDGVSIGRMVESALEPGQGAASTPDHIFRIARMDSRPVKVRAASDTASGAYTNQIKKPDAGAVLALHSLEAERCGRYGYENSYNQSVDLASGCIMHYPIFASNKKFKEQQQRIALQIPPQPFPTLSPPDFSRQSFGSPAGLSPRQSAKRRQSGASKLSDNQQALEPQQQDEPTAEREGVLSTCLRSEITSDTVQPLAEAKVSDCSEHLPGGDDGKTGKLLSESCPNALLPTRGTERLSPLSCAEANKASKSENKNRSHKQRFKSTIDEALHHHQRGRLSTAESGRSMLSTFSNSQAHRISSRPGTATSTRSNTSFRLMRRRRGLFATLDLHLGNRLSGFSQDASVAAQQGRNALGGSFDSQRSCSAGTFGGDAASPLSAPRCHDAMAPTSPMHLEAKKSSSSS